MPHPRTPDHDNPHAEPPVLPQPGAPGPQDAETIDFDRLEPASGQVLFSLNPATGVSLGTVSCAGPDDIDRAVASASAIQALWHGTPLGERCALVHRLADRMEEQAEDLAQLVATEQGKPVVEALALEILPALDHLRYVADHAERLTTNVGIDPREPLFAHKRSYYLFDAIGVVAVITPFNLPLAIPMIQLATALVMGNGVVFKPSELTPFCGARIAALVAEAGFPHGLVNVIQTSGEETLFLAAHPDIDKIFFTGSRDTARLILAGAGWSPRPMVMALGGKHPAIVAADADLDRAARGVVWGALANCGQNCGAVERVYVERAVAARFVDRVLSAVDRLRVGDPLAEGTDVGPLVSAGRREAVHAQVLEAIEKGAHRLRGGTIPDGPGFFYPPTVLLGAPQDAQIMREETLGPVLSIVVVENVEQGVLLANDCEYALTASAWTSSSSIADRVMEGLEAGVVTVNDVLYSFGEPAATWSGHKASGSGHTHAAAGLREMSRMKFVSHDLAPSEAPVFAFPYDETAGPVARAAISALHAPGRFARFGGALRLAFSKRFRNRVPLRSFLPAWKRRGR